MILSSVLVYISFTLWDEAQFDSFFHISPPQVEFGIKSCYHSHTEDVVIRISMGVLIQILCSYVTLPLYALVAQMGSSMKPTIFNERVVMALRNWHQTAKKHMKQNRGGPSLSVTPMSTPSLSMSPVHLLHYYRSQIDSFPASPRRSIEIDDSPSTSYSHPHKQLKTDSIPSASSPSFHHHEIERDHRINEDPTLGEIVIAHSSKEFSFDKRTINTSN